MNKDNLLLNGAWDTNPNSFAKNSVNTALAALVLGAGAGAVINLKNRVALGRRLSGGWIYVLNMSLAWGAFSVPFSLCRTFVLEKRRKTHIRNSDLFFDHYPKDQLIASLLGGATSGVFIGYVYGGLGAIFSGSVMYGGIMFFGQYLLQRMRSWRQDYAFRLEHPELFPKSASSGLFESIGGFLKDPTKALPGEYAVIDKYQRKAVESSDMDRLVKRINDGDTNLVDWETVQLDEHDLKLLETRPDPLSELSKDFVVWWRRFVQSYLPTNNIFLRATDDDYKFALEGQIYLLTDELISIKKRIKQLKEEKNS